jgi:hypothetical protein
MKNQFYRKIAFALIVPLLLLGSVCCHSSVMACTKTPASCSLISSLTHQSHSSCDTSASKKSCKDCDCYKISGVTDQNHSIAIPGKDAFVSGHFILSPLKAHSLTPRFFNYQSPPKVVQNPLPLYLQISVLRL